MIKVINIILILVFLVSSVAHAKPNQKAIRNLQKDLEKIESSIMMTKGKIKAAQDINYLPDLYFMLAELLVDKSRLMFVLKKEKNAGAKMGEVDFTAEKRVLQDAIDTYKTIEDRYPNFSDLDKVMFTMGLELKSLGDPDGALKVFRRVSEKFKASKYNAGALLEVGNIFFNKKDYEFALVQYQKVLDLPKSTFSPVAHYKIGWCYIFLQKYMSSLQSFESVMKFSDADFDKSEISEFKNSDVREEALNASVWPYSELTPADFISRPELNNPISYYQKLAFDKTSFRRVLLKLSKRMELKKRPKVAAEAYLRLLKISDDLNEKKDAMENYYLQARTLKIEYFPTWFAQSVAETLWSLKTFEKKNSKKGYSVYEPLLRDVATTIQKTAQKTKRKDDFKQSIDAYKAYLWVFPKSKVQVEMQFNLAESYFGAGDFVNAGIMYGEAHANIRKSKLASKEKEVLDSSVESFVEAFKNFENLSRVEKLQGREGFRKIAKVFLNKYPNDSAVPTVIFNQAKSYYDEQKMSDAASGFRQFLSRFGGHELATQAAVLLLDCYYIRDDIKGLSSEVRRLQGLPNLSDSLKNKMNSVLQQAQLKKVRSVAGDFQSKTYANKFLEFAKSNKGSSLGETALLEAFASFRAVLDPKAYEVGEAYVSQYSDNPKSKEVLLNLIQFALVNTEYRRAAKYLVSFGQRYKEDGSSRESILQGARLFEQLGDLEEASDSYVIGGDLTSASRVLEMNRDWEGLNKVASQLSGLPAKYYQGLAYVRMGRKKEGVELLRRILPESPSSTAERVMYAHSGIIVSESDMETFNNIGSGQGFSIQTLQAKASSFQAIDGQVQQIVSQGAGSWTLASIYLMGQLNLNFAKYLAAAKAPAGMNPAQFSTMIASQIASYKKSALEKFKVCLQVAEQNELFSRYVEACRSKGDLSLKESQEIKSRFKAQTNGASDNKNLRIELMKNPRDTKLLNELALIKVQGKDYAYASAIYQRAIEIDPSNAQYYANAGVCYLHLNLFEMAQETFSEALKRDSKNKTAAKGLAGLFKKFGFSNKFNSLKGNAQGSLPSKVPTHPWMVGL